MFPYFKVFIDNQSFMNILWYSDEHKHGFRRSGQIGEGLVSFCELDLTALEDKLNELAGIPLTSTNYDMLRNGIFDAAELLKDKHDYAFFFLVGTLNNILATPVYIQDNIEARRLEHLQSCISILKDMPTLQEIFQYALCFCLDKDNLSDRSASERLVGFYFQFPDLSKFTVQTGFAVAPVKKGALDYEKVAEIHRENITDTRQTLEAISGDRSKVSLLPYYRIQSLDEMLFLEFMEMLKRGIQVKRCRLCGRYCVLIDKRRREYCGREYSEGKTCQDVGPLLRYEQNLEADEYLRKFETEYNKIYSRFYRADGKTDAEFSGKDMTRDEFRTWSKAASKAKADYQKRLITGEEMLSIVRAGT
jgi:hypothetical protein